MSKKNPGKLAAKFKRHRDSDTGGEEVRAKPKKMKKPKKR